MAVNVIPFHSYRVLEICPFAWRRPTSLSLMNLTKRGCRGISFCPSVMSGPASGLGSFTLWWEQWVPGLKAFPSLCCCLVFIVLCQLYKLHSREEFTILAVFLSTLPPITEWKRTLAILGQALLFSDCVFRNHGGIKWVSFWDRKESEWPCDQSADSAAVWPSDQLHKPSHVDITQTYCFVLLWANWGWLLTLARTLTATPGAEGESVSHPLVPFSTHLVCPFGMTLHIHILPNMLLKSMK